MALEGIHINADLGEDYGRYTIVDLDAILPMLSACNVACGFHAGDPITIDATLDKAKQYDLEVGAHPSYPDLQGFGRRSMDIKKSDLTSILRYQISALAGMAKSKGITLTHVKPHGALYNDAAKKRDVAEAVCDALASFSSSMVLYVPPESVVASLAIERDLSIRYEAFIDRTYEDDLSLTPRSRVGALITDATLATQHTTSMFRDNEVITTSGSKQSLKADTFCIHGDNAAALEILRSIHG